MSEYTLDTEEKEIEPIDVSTTPDFSDKEKELLQKIEVLTNELADEGVTCFVASKFKSQENPSAAWHFGTDPNVALSAFAKDYAPLFLHITSKFTGTKIVASNVDNGSTVYEVDPRVNQDSQSETQAQPEA